MPYARETKRLTEIPKGFVTNEYIYKHFDISYSYLSRVKAFLQLKQTYVIQNRKGFCVYSPEDVKKIADFIKSKKPIGKYKKSANAFSMNEEGEGGEIVLVREDDNDEHFDKLDWFPNIDSYEFLTECNYHRPIKYKKVRL